MNLIQQLEKEQVEKLSAGKTIPEFGPGDTVIVNVKVVEGERSRIQAYEGVCIARAGRSLHENFTVRKISYGEGVERVFPLYSPMIELDQGRAPRQGAPRQALLPARPARQEGPHRRGCRTGRRGSGGSQDRVAKATFSDFSRNSPRHARLCAGQVGFSASHQCRARCPPAREGL